MSSNSPIGKQYLETFKHKLITKFQLEDVDLTSKITRFLILLQKGKWFMLKSTTI